MWPAPRNSTNYNVTKCPKRPKSFFSISKNHIIPLERDKLKYHVYKVYDICTSKFQIDLNVLKLTPCCLWYLWFVFGVLNDRVVAFQEVEELETLKWKA